MWSSRFFLALFMFYILLLNTGLAKEISFDEALNYLLDDFSISVKAGELHKVKTVSVRKIELSEQISKSYSDYLLGKFHVILANDEAITSVRCLVCREIKSRNENGVYRSYSDVDDFSYAIKVASSLGIESWMDVSLVYSNEELILSIKIFEAQTGLMLWTRSYSSLNLDVANGVGHVVKNGKKEDWWLGLNLGYYSFPNVSSTINLIGIETSLFRSFDVLPFFGEIFIGALIDPMTPLGLYRNYNISQPVSDVNLKWLNSKEQSNLNVEKLEILPLKHLIFLGGNLNVVLQHFNGGSDLSGVLSLIGFCGGGVVAGEGYLAATAKGGLRVVLYNQYFVSLGGLYSLPAKLRISDVFEVESDGGLGFFASVGLFF